MCRGKQRLAWVDFQFCQPTQPSSQELDDLGAIGSQLSAAVKKNSKADLRLEKLRAEIEILSAKQVVDRRAFRLLVSSKVTPRCLWWPPSLQQQFLLRTMCQCHQLLHILLQ